MKRSSYRIPVIASAALAVVGAAPAGHSVSDHPNNPADVPQQAEATVLVRNHNPLDVEVVAVTDAGRRFRLGEVNGDAGGTFVLPQTLTDGSGQFRLKVYSLETRVGSFLVNRYLEAVNTQPLSVSPGSAIVLQVVSPLRNSFVDGG